MGHALDEISDYGSSQLFAEVAFGIAIEHDLLGCLNHLDSTSMSVHGEYKNSDKEPDEDPEEPSVIQVTYGHSKAHRPDLKQVVMSLVVNGRAGIPVFMEPLSGNNSDKASFHETIKKVREFQGQINCDKQLIWVGDSALYSKTKLLKNNDYLWLTRVPETIQEARHLVERPDTKINWRARDNGYKTAAFRSSYGEIEQRWLLVYSEQAYQREKKTLDKNLEKKDELLRKALWHLGNELFSCKQDALSVLEKIEKTYGMYKIKGEVEQVLKYAKAGKPKPGEEKVYAGCKLVCTFERDSDEVAKILNKKGRFILATNELDESSYSDELMLAEYKDQQKVERGFGFLKDPWFMVDSIFLKSERRIEALMMVMTLCLLVYNIAQYKLRHALKEQEETLPNQLGKPIQNPTVKWIFQLMEGIGIVRMYRMELVKSLEREIITNLDSLRRKIIGLFGDTALKMYGLAVT